MAARISKSSFEIAGKVGFVTGGAKGIGRAVCEALLEKGAKVCFTDVNIEIGTDVLSHLELKFGKENVLFVIGDVTSEEQFEAGIIQAKEKFGHLDILINNAGITGERNWRRTIDVNLNGTMIGVHLAHKHLTNAKGEPGGVVVNNSSNLGLTSNHFTPAYCTTKHAIIGLTKSWGDIRNFSRTQVKVNVVCSYATDTELFYNFYEDCVDPDSANAHKSVTTPMTPLAVAAAFMKVIEDNVTGAVAILKSEKDGLQYLDYQNVQ